MYLGRTSLSILICAGCVVAMASGVVRQERATFLFGQPSASGAPLPTFDWWPFDDNDDDFGTSLVSQPSLTSSGPSRLPATTTSSTPTLSPAPTPVSPSPSIIDITALPPATTNAPRPRILTKQNLKPFSLVPLFALAGFLPGALAGWLVLSSYERWVTKSDAVALLPGPAYIPVRRVDKGADDGRSQSVRDVEGSPSKHTRHGTPYSSYSVGRGLLGRIPSSRFYQPLPSITQERTKTNNSGKSFAWPPLPGSSRSTSSHSCATTNNSIKSTQTTTAISDDPFTLIRNNSTVTDTKSQTLIVASRTSTRSTFAHASRFGEMWSEDEEDQDAVVVSSFSPTLPAEGGEARPGLLKIRSKSKPAKGKSRDERSTGGTSELTSPGKGSWNFPWTPGSPSVKPDSYTTMPTRASSPRSQSFRTPESSPRKPSHVHSSDKVRFVDRSVLPTSPPTLTSPRLESELFLSATVFDIPRTPTPKRTRSSRAVNGVRRDEERNDIGTPTVDTTPPSSLRLGEFERYNEGHSPTARNSRPGPSRRLSTASASTISEFLGDPPPKRTPAERFYARHSALDRVDEIIQKSRSQTSVAKVTMKPGKPTSDNVEGRRPGRVGKKFLNGGIEQRLLEP